MQIEKMINNREKILLSLLSDMTIILTSLSAYIIVIFIGLVFENPPIDTPRVLGSMAVGILSMLIILYIGRKTYDVRRLIRNGLRTDIKKEDGEVFFTYEDSVSGLINNFTGEDVTDFRIGRFFVRIEASNGMIDYQSYVRKSEIENCEEMRHSIIINKI